MAIRYPEVSRELYIESVYHLIFIGATIKSFESSLEKLRGLNLSNRDYSEIRYPFHAYCLILTNSLLDEMNHYLFKYQGEDGKEKVQDFKSVIQPVLEAINQWDIKKFRHNALAHNLRVDSEGFRSILLSNKLKDYFIPDRESELLYLMSCIEIITEKVWEFFSTEYEEALVIVDSHEEKTAKQLSKSEIQEQLDELQNRVNSNIEDLRRRHLG